jgi:hypothetical protein
MNDLSLKEYVDQRFQDQEKAVLAALASADKQVSAALMSAEKAVDRAEINAERWRNNANEWRGALSDRERDYLSRREFYVMLGTAVAITGLAIGFLR